MDSSGERRTEQAITRSSSFALVQRFRLVVVSGKSSGRTCVSDGPRVVVGAHRSSDLILDDPTTSRFHCEVVVEAGRAVLRDLGSRNGTRLNGLEVREAILEPGTLLRIGDSEVRFELGADQVRVPLSDQCRFGQLVARSESMRAVFAVLERTAPTDATILIEGETGTGKGVVAESIHEESRRRDGPFVVVDCGGLPATLLENELFGHRAGAFTGAVETRLGAFEAADGGTIFLDEIGELPLDLQPKLLRVLESKQVKRLGENEYRTVDVRMVAATNRDLRAEVNQRHFRSDLYYRLAVVQVRLPALCDRPEDIPVLAEALLIRLDPGAAAIEAAGVRTSEFLAQLGAHRWPGNVRELRNYLERCLAFGEPLPLSNPPAGQPSAPSVVADRPIKEAREEWVRLFERGYLVDLLARHEGNVTAAARAAGVARVHLYRLLWRHGLR
jgi:DNA-binding NtrC family response regulator